MLKIIAGTAGFFILLWGGAYVTDLIPHRHWAVAPAFLTIYVFACACASYAVYSVVQWWTAQVTEKLRDAELRDAELRDEDLRTEKHVPRDKVTYR